MNVNHALNRSIQGFCQANLAEAECIRVADLGCAHGSKSWSRSRSRPGTLHIGFGISVAVLVPSGLVTEEGLPLNKGNIYMGKTSPKSVHDAYLNQFDRDFTNFLSARADELVSGGHSFVTLAPKIGDPVAYNVQDLLGMTMNDMVSEGLIEEKTLDIFNLPHYRPSLEEVKTIIEKNRALKLSYLDTIQLRVIGAGAADCGKGYVFNANYRARSLRAIYEPIFQAHFGDGIMNNFFTKLAANISQHQGKMKRNCLVLSLSRT